MAWANMPSVALSDTLRLRSLLYCNHHPAPHHHNPPPHHHDMISKNNNCTSVLVGCIIVRGSIVGLDLIWSYLGLSLCKVHQVAKKMGDHSKLRFIGLILCSESRPMQTELRSPFVFSIETGWRAEKRVVIIWCYVRRLDLCKVYLAFLNKLLSPSTPVTTTPT